MEVLSSNQANLPLLICFITDIIWDFIPLLTAANYSNMYSVNKELNWIELNTETITKSANSDYDIMRQKLKNHAQVIVEKLHPSSNNWKTLQSDQRMPSREHVKRQPCHTHMLYMYSSIWGARFFWWPNSYNYRHHFPILKH